MLWKFVVALFAVLCPWGAAYAGCPVQTMSTGWCWPVTPGTLQLGWHGPNSSFSGQHLAQDIKASEGTSVYAIARGVVKAARTDVSYYGGAQNPGCPNGTSISGAGVIIRHAASNGQGFDVLYAHMKNLTVSVGDEVGAGQKIGEIRNYTWCGTVMNHLHFGVEYPARTQAQIDSQADIWAGYGTSDRGFVNPLLFLQSVYPAACNASSVTCSMKKVGNVAWFPAVTDCTKASQWYFVTRDTNGEYVTVGSATAAACPLYCPAN